MNRPPKRFGYVVALVATLLVWMARLALHEALGDQAPLLPFVLAVMAAAWWDGFGPGMLATVASLLVGLFFFVSPPLSWELDTAASALNAVIFVVIGVTISLLCEALHQAKRRETEKQFRVLADSIPQLVWMARPDGYRTWFNRRYYEYTGATPGQVVGSGWQSFHDPAELPRVLASLKRSLATGQPWEETFPLRRKDGQMRWQLARAMPVRNDIGDVVCWFGTNTDISERMENEQALKDADVRKDEFLATLAHELRNPLAPISNAVQLWPFMVDEPEELERLRTVIARQTQQMIRLIDDLMDVSRVTQGKITLRPQIVELRSVLDGAIETVEPLMKLQKHRLTVSMPDQPIILRVDVARLTQVFANILNNAAKYTPPGGSIELTANRNGDHALVCLRDNGAGIPANMLQSIFEMFRQVDQTLARSCGGLGIGLMLARRFVELHGGTIEARSDGPGRGTEFRVTLPVLSAAEQASSSAGQQTDPASLEISPPLLPADSTPVPRRKVLVVDDLRESAETLAALLRSLGHDVVTRHDGQTALAWAKANHPDVIFLDIAMPGMDGYEVARRLREMPQSPALVALTGYGQAEDRRRASAAGFHFHLTKPTNARALQEILLGLQETGRETMTAHA
ncbi:MAG TPA: ATP-binding protein [Pirellulales bacterium]